MPEAIPVPQTNPTIKHRFSSLRFRKAVKKFNPIQLGYIWNHNLSHLLNIPDHLIVSLHLIQWLVVHTSCASTGSYYFQHKDKKFHFTKDIVDKVFGFPRSSVPFVLDSRDPEVIIEVESIRRQYLQGNSIPVGRVESLMLGTNNEIVFLRSFILFFITTVLCPSTYNFVNPKYLYSLRDKDVLHVEHYDFGTLCLHHLFEEIENWKNKIFMNTGDFNRVSWIGGCLPLLGVGYKSFQLFFNFSIFCLSISLFSELLNCTVHVFLQVAYLDFVDFNGNAGDIDYRVPRMTYIKNADFVHLQNVDRNLNSRKSYGVLRVRIDELFIFFLFQIVVFLKQVFCLLMFLSWFFFQIKDISDTPYGMPMMIPLPPQLQDVVEGGANNGIEDVLEVAEVRVLFFQ